MNTTESIPRNSFMTSAQLARYLGVTDRWIRKLAIDKGFGVKFGHTWMFTQEECEHLLQERKNSPEWHAKRKSVANKA